MEVRDLWPESIVEYNGMSRKNPIIQVLYQLEKWIYKKSDALIFTMAGGKEYICDKNWNKAVNLDKVNYVNNGVDLKEFEEDIKKYQTEDEDLEDDSKFKVVYVGSIRKANNVQNLVEVAKELKKRDENKILILIYGDGTDKQELESICQKENLKNVKFKGKVEKKYIPYILSKSNLNILNYKQADTWKYGGSQNKQFEYLASGRPICANVKMGYSIINKNKCGIEENIDTIQRYSDIILEYKNMSSEEYLIQCENAQNVAKDFDYNVLGRKVEKILYRLTN